ncbi:hypothetical protein SAMN05444266_11189 [Chitinophaga jiangningensis]|uniref:Outer membrane protein beta-barrel domain-containing protein n=1 Tax=Chitinophaga jiangningensis TaxID=1419482 RepID=A0A1M7LQM6_9BACT|nr:hypothetical protein [Chitinophaga jiangningensis]SHM80485.1 hypothetical protein SAMN05444266_11189 [Chitinophaga jiangningensis]
MSTAGNQLHQRFLMITACLACCLLLTITTHAQKKTKPSPPWYVEKYKVSAGAFFPINNTDISVGTQNGNAGTNVDFEDDLGFNRNTSTFYADLQWRASPHSRFNLTYYRVARSSTKVLQRDITFGDHTYNVNAEVDAHFNTNIYRFSYGYAFFVKPKWEAGLLVGAHIVGLNAGIGLTGNNVGANVSDDFGVTAPLPDLGVWGSYSFAKKWYLNAEFDYFSLKVNDYKGKILAYNLNVNYRAWRGLDVAVGYTGLNARVDANKEHLLGYFKWGYNGPSVTVSYSFGRNKWNR